MTGTTNGGGGGNSGDGVQHGAIGTTGWSHTGVTGGLQTNTGPHSNADACVTVRAMVQIKRSKQERKRPAMRCSWIIVIKTE
jgi:hypothetical protein